MYEQLRLPEHFRNGIEREQCENCSTHVEILKREAVLSLHSVSIAPFLPKNLIAASKANTEQASNSPQLKVRAVAPVAAEKSETTETRKSAGQYHALEFSYFATWTDLLFCLSAKNLQEDFLTIQNPV